MSIQTRIEALREYAEKKGLDAVLVTSPENIFYFSGFTGSSGFLLVSKYACNIFVDFRYLLQARQQCPDYAVIDIKPGLYYSLNNVIATQNIKLLGYEDRHITCYDFSAMEKNIGCTLLGVGADVAKIRSVKEAAELDLLKEAARLTDEAFQYICTRIRPDVTERELSYELEWFLRKNGSSGMAFPTILASGARSALPHGRPTSKKLENGDFVLIDFGCVFSNYCSDMTRTVVVGEASSRQKEIYNIVSYAYHKAINSIVPGVNTSQIHADIFNTIASFGYGDNFGHDLGHGIGLTPTEAPSVSANSQDVLAPRNVITVEPGIYIEGFGGVRIESAVIVGETENIVLSGSTVDLLVL